MLPLQRRFLPLSKLVDYHYWYHRTNANITHALKKAKINTQTAQEIEMGREAWDRLEEIRINDPAQLERIFRQHLTRFRFSSFAPAERKIREIAKLTKMRSGMWRATVAINGVHFVTYNETAPLVIRDAAQQLVNEFPEIQ
jgi:hypothetical protein